METRHDMIAEDDIPMKDVLVPALKMLVENGAATVDDEFALVAVIFRVPKEQPAKGDLVEKVRSQIEESWDEGTPRIISTILIDPHLKGGDDGDR